MKTVLYTYAVDQEFISINAGKCIIKPLCTGIGKTKSAMLLTNNICQQKPDLVINVGTAGTLKHNIGDIFIVDKFIDRDLELLKLPGVNYIIDGFELIKPLKPLFNKIKTYSYLANCSTGDTFVLNADAIKEDIVDMEAFAQAEVCEYFNIPFVSVKYITDIIGQNSINLWETKLSEARNNLTKWFDQKDFFTDLF